jgi:hypothetical protein
MDAITITALSSVLVFFPLKTACIAKSLGRKFWVWFFMGLCLPFFGLVILLCLPITRLKVHANDPSQKQQTGKGSPETLDYQNDHLGDYRLLKKLFSYSKLLSCPLKPL